MDWSTGKAPVRVTFSSLSHSHLIKVLAASALASSPLSNTQKPLTRYSRTGLPSAEGKGREMGVTPLDSMVAALLPAAEVPQQNSKAVVPDTNSSMDWPPLYCTPLPSQPLLIHSWALVRPWIMASLLKVYFSPSATEPSYRLAIKARVPWSPPVAPQNSTPGL